MTPKPDKKPTAAELEILQILWKHKSGTVKFVHERINTKKNVGYTTTLKIMQNMAAKNILKRKLQGKSHIYIPAIRQEETQSLLLDRFIETAFSGSAGNLVMQLLGNHRPSGEELKQIKELINKLDRGKS